MPEKAITWPTTVRNDKASGKVFVLSSSAKSRKVKVNRSLIAAIEEGDLTRLAGKRKVSPEELKQLLSLCDEIGALGEQAVLRYERQRLRKLGFKEQANKVVRVSLQSVGEGYDILSFEDDGITKRYLEVKATIGKGSVVDVSRGEWRAARIHGEHYYLVRVMTVINDPKIYFIENPVKLEQEGLVTRTPVGWTIDLLPVLKKA